MSEPSDPVMIGPGPACPACGEVYGMHLPDCERGGAQPTKMRGVLVSDADAAKGIYMPMLRLRYGEGISFVAAIGKLWDEVKAAEGK